MPEQLAVTSQGPVTVVAMRAGENRFNPSFVEALEAAVTSVEDAEGPGALVLTGEGKFFSNGLDLEWMQGAAEGEPQALVGRVQGLLARVLVCSVPTVAAINGHAFAAGAMLAAACDLRVMREDRGFFCLPEVDIGLPFTPGMSALLAAKLNPGARARAMVFGERLGAGEASALGIVDAAVPESDVLAEATRRAEALAAKRGPTMAAIKTELYREAAAALRAPPPGAS